MHIRLPIRRGEVSLNHSAVSKLLRDNRKQQHLSVNEVVYLLNRDYQIPISSKTLYSWENNQAQPPINTFFALCNIYNIKSIYKDITLEKGPVPLKLSEEEREIILKYRSRNYCNSAIRKLLDID